MIATNFAAGCPYDIGDYLITESTRTPMQRWPGTTWVQVQGRMPLGASSAYPLGSEGGAATVKLTEPQLPKIFGSIHAGAGAYGADAGGFGAFRRASGVFSTDTEMQNGRPKDAQPWPSGADGKAWSFVNMNFGGNQAHENMPPFRAVYIWRRTA